MSYEWIVGGTGAKQHAFREGRPVSRCGLQVRSPIAVPGWSTLPACKLCFRYADTEPPAESEPAR